MANDEEIPELPQIQEHLKVCPLCRFTYRTFLAAVKDDPSLDPHEEMPEHFSTPLHEWLLSRSRAHAPSP